MAMTTMHGSNGSNGKGAETIDSVSPATGEILGTVPVAGVDEVSAAVARARAASRRWGAMGWAERRALDQLAADVFVEPAGDDAEAHRRYRCAGACR